MPAKGKAISSENTVVIARLILTIPALPPTVSRFFQFAIPAEEPSMCGLPIYRFSIGRAIAFLVIASLSFCRTSVADEPIAEPNLRIAKLVERLGSESCQDRQQASNELAKIGNESRNQLEAAAKSDDLEIRLRAGELLRQVKLSDMWLPSMVEYHAHGEPVREVVDAICRQSKNRILVGDAYGSFENRPARIDYEAGAYWQVIDDLCHATGNFRALGGPISSGRLPSATDFGSRRHRYRHFLKLRPISDE